MLEPLTQARKPIDLDRASDEQLKKNQAIQSVLRQWLDEDVTSEDLNERAQFWEEFKEIIDSSRESGCKLYSPE